MRFSLLLVILAFHNHALGLSCNLTEEPETKMQLSRAFEDAQVVAYVEFKEEPRRGIFDVEVLRVWKGEIGSSSYVRDSGAGLIFAQRAGEGPLVLTQDPTWAHCRLVSLQFDNPMLEIEKLERLWGPGSVPAQNRMELLDSKVQTAWVVSLIVGGSVLMLVLVGAVNQRSGV